MAADKTIFECPVITMVSQLDGGNRLVIQQGSASLQDYGLPLNLLAQWLGQNNNADIFGGSANPDNAAGSNGDLYFQNNGKIYKKQAGVWVFKTQISIPTVPAPVTQLIPDGQPAPYVLSAPQLAAVNAMGRYPVYAAYINNVQFSDMEPVFVGGVGAFTSITIPLHQSGGLNLDPTYIQFT